MFPNIKQQMNDNEDHWDDGKILEFVELWGEVEDLHAEDDEIVENEHEDEEQRGQVFAEKGLEADVQVDVVVSLQEEVVHGERDDAGF